MGGTKPFRPFLLRMVAPVENRYEVYRNIRQQRTYRTLGKMTWWRIVLGLLLLALVFLLSGAVSDSFAARGNFTLAEALMISPEWMERYRPEDKRFINAGALYQRGEYEGAMEALDSLALLRDASSSDGGESREDDTAFRSLRSAVVLSLAEQRLQEGRAEDARALLPEVDSSLLDEAQLARLQALQVSLAA